MIHRLLPLFALLLCNSIFAQQDEQPDVFSGCLVKVTTTDSLQWLDRELQRIRPEEIAADALHSVPAPGGNWKLRYFTSAGTVYDYSGQQQPGADNVNASKINKNCHKAYTTKEIQGLFSIPDSLFIDGFPVVYKRNDIYNRKCTALIRGAYLMLRYVHSYPNGNMRSWYVEEIYYFKKEE
jgi:hypothetical protein